MGHGNTSCDPHLHQSHQATNAPLPHAKRLPHGGYVLTGQTGKLNAQSWNVIFLKSQNETNIFPPIVFVLPCRAPSSLWPLQSRGRQNQLRVHPESKQTRQLLTNVRFLHDSEPLPLYHCEGGRLRS